MNFMDGMNFYMWKLFNFLCVIACHSRGFSIERGSRVASKFFSGVDTLVHSTVELEDMKRNR